MGSAFPVCARVKIDRSENTLRLSTDIRERAGVTALNLGLSVITFGLWIIPWIVVGVLSFLSRKKLTVAAAEDQGGTVVVVECDEEWAEKLRSWLMREFVYGGGGG